jgi:serine acetyltransferase
MIGAGSVVTRDVPPYALVLGNPAEIKGWVCECGRRLVDIVEEDDYKTIYKCSICEKAIEVEKKWMKG